MNLHSELANLLLFFAAILKTAIFTGLAAFVVLCGAREWLRR